ncbi:CaiB/BaiF CoA transferase family protein [Actinomadura algeriensis]|uniref:Alpha-methylacyl-CoA racemase n=1 Tax=Actinomadura algeriensis TaxID=1679523 RepID=A0ABR9K1V4_9ACTN|nr:CaiB/BaiF CoA-transferase family protein [Actinomadura algeriensis]MBE1536812.1 alpha-methylacyl-CoA racemase [Actinomadura algeriensis]
MSARATPPLDGIRVVELGGIGPVPHAGMLLASLGADVVRVERSGAEPDERAWDGTRRGRTVISADLKSAEDVRRIRALVAAADVLVEGFRPGAAERTGLGPDELRALNPGLVYGRMTGWGQHGPWAGRAGHDINYIGLTGALHAIGDDRPLPPLNLVGDFGGGSAYLVLGVVSALVRRGRTGEGCEIDAAIVDGTGSLMQLIWSLRADGRWQDRRAANLLDGGTPFYRTYRCADGGWMAVGALEPVFYRAMLDGLGLTGPDVPDRADPARWPELEALLASTFASRPRRHWESVFEGTDACVTPVLTMDEAPAHPHMAARSVLRNDPGGVLAAAAPREAGAEASYLTASTHLSVDEALRRWREPTAPRS